MKTNNLAVFISGKGTNALNIISFFQNSKSTTVRLVFSTKENEQIQKVCKEKNIVFYYSKKIKSDLEEEQANLCMVNNISLIVLAGYLKQIPESLIKLYPNKIINLHPSLLPKYGGKGMYGKYVHQAVLEAKEAYSGITIHYVNDAFDDGAIIAQFSIALLKNETLESLELKIRALEKEHFASIIAKILI
jgi:phosphoribosylglycinamide formyltransferase 1